MTGADTVSLEGGISENLKDTLMIQVDATKASLLFAQYVSETSDSVLCVLDKLVLGLIADVL